MSIALQKMHPLLDESLVNSLDDYWMILRAQLVYGYASKLCAKKVVMEVGCNTGFCTGLIAGSAAKVFALDVNESALAYAKKNHAASNIDYVLVDGKTFPPIDPKPEVAVFFQLIEHISDDRKFLADVREAISPSGTVVFTTPNAKLRLRPKQKPWNPFHVREYTYAELKALVDGQFPSYEIYGVFGMPAVHAMEKKRVKQTWWKRRVVGPFREATGYFSVRAKLRQVLGLTTPTSEVFDLERAQATYGENSFFISEENIEDALDFLVIARKG